MTIWCESPMPSVTRPRAAACADSACCAMATGWRGNVGTTAVPSSIRDVSRPQIAAARIASMPKMLANQPLAKPSASARFAWATRPSTSAGAPAMSPMPMPIFMGGVLAHPGCAAKDGHLDCRTTRGETFPQSGASGGGRGAADVVKVEPPEGDRARRRGPFWGGVVDAERSLLWLALNTSKRGMTLALDRPRGRELFLALAERADVVLETEPPGSLAARGLGWETLHARNRRAILCSITPFGQTGPRAAWRGSDLTVVATSGNLYATGDPDRAPVRCSLPVSYYHGGLEAAVGVLFALLARDQSGEGQHVDVSLQAAMVMPSIGTAAMFRMTGQRGARVGAFMSAGRTVQREIWPCKDGFVSFALRGGPARVPGLIAMGA